MAVPDYQSLMLPLLKVLGDGEEQQPCEEMWFDRSQLVVEGAVDFSLSQNINQLRVQYQN